MKRNVLSFFDLTGKTAVVTGAGSGLGRAMAEAMGEAGARVACVDIDAGRARETSDKIRTLDVDSIFLACDVTSEKEVVEAFRSIVTEFGRVDILFNNAGIPGPNVQLHQVSLEEWNRVISVDLTGIFLCAKEAVKIMLEQRSGKIINTGSLWSFRGGFPLLPVPPYHAAKGGVISLTREMALEYAKDGITVNAIVPGFFDTNISTRLRDENFYKAVVSSIPIGRVGMPEDMKGTALFLASEASDYLTGAAIPVDGGYMSK
jgi:NAD(P)-dependent dehydrogenase (short-subunit alcohol dehydrogenase family)